MPFPLTTAILLASTAATPAATQGAATGADSARGLFQLSLSSGVASEVYHAAFRHYGVIGRATMLVRGAHAGIGVIVDHAYFPAVEGRIGSGSAAMGGVLGRLWLPIAPYGELFAGAGFGGVLHGVEDEPCGTGDEAVYVDAGFSIFVSRAVAVGASASGRLVVPRGSCDETRGSARDSDEVVIETLNAITLDVAFRFGDPGDRKAKR